MGKTRYWVHHESDSLLITYGEGKDYQHYRDALEVEEINKDTFEKLKAEGYTV